MNLELKLPTANCSAPPELAELVAKIAAELNGVPPNRVVEIDNAEISSVLSNLRTKVADASGQPVDSFDIGDVTAQAAGSFFCLSVRMKILPAEDFTYDPVAVAQDLILQTAHNSKMSSGEMTKYVSEIQLLTEREYLRPHEVHELHILRDFEDNVEDMEAMKDFESRNKMDFDTVRLANKHYASPKTKETQDARSGFRGVFGDQSDFFAGLHNYGGRPLVAGDQKLKEAMEQEFLKCTDARICNIRTSNYGCVLILRLPAAITFLQSIGVIACKQGRLECSRCSPEFWFVAQISCLTILKSCTGVLRQTWRRSGNLQ